MSYKSDQACRRLSTYIADDIRSPVIALQNADPISVLFDGATDNTTIEVEVVFVRYVSDGEPKSAFLSLQEAHHAHA